MLGGDDDKGRLPGGGRKGYWRSVSWTERSPTKPNHNTRLQPNSTARSCLPPLQPLSINRRNVEEWPRAGCDDLGIWPNPETPRGSVKSSQNSDSEHHPREFQFRKDKLAFFDKECSRIVDHIYLGSEAVARNRDVLKQNGITHVLNCVGFVCPEYFRSDFVYKTLWLQDSPTEDITSILYDVFDYFEDVRDQGGRVFVHCCQGVSRSTSLVIAYLMWREGQSFEDAFQNVKAARGVTNPNMGFACQLLQCQKRVHAVPASPNSILRMYRMAPHSQYAPLHLVPKMLDRPSAEGLDSRGAFVVHVPTAIYVWEGKSCNSVMLNRAKATASQVVRYERAKGPIVSIREGEEPPEFWNALKRWQPDADGCEKVEAERDQTLCVGEDDAAMVIDGKVGKRKVDEYNLDFEIFHKALSGGVVPPFAASNTESENCLPARENGWHRVRKKLAEGVMKEIVMASKQYRDAAAPADETVDMQEESEQPASPISASSPPLSPTAYLCVSPGSFDRSLNDSPDRISDTSNGMRNAVSDASPLMSPTHLPGSPESFYQYSGSSPRFNSKSPTLSPSTSDFSSPFSFSPSSSNWSDLSYLSSQQPSPSGWESADPAAVKSITPSDGSSLLSQETSSSPAQAIPTNHTLRLADNCLMSKGSCPSIAQRRGSNPPPPMLLPSIEVPFKSRRNMVRTLSFSLPDLEDDMVAEVTKYECSSEELMIDIGNSNVCDENKSDLEGEKEQSEKRSDMRNSALYQWPSMNKVESPNLDGRSAYILLAPDVSFDSNVAFRLFIWLGREYLHEEQQNQATCSGDKHGEGHLQWEMIGLSFISHMGLPRNIPLQIVKEGEEPEQFLKHLSCLSAEKSKNTDR